METSCPDEYFTTIVWIFVLIKLNFNYISEEVHYLPCKVTPSPPENCNMILNFKIAAYNHLRPEEGFLEPLHPLIQITTIDNIWCHHGLLSKKLKN